MDGANARITASYWPRYRCPHRWFVGAGDEYTPVADVEFMHKRVQGSVLAVIDGAARRTCLT